MAIWTAVIWFRVSVPVLSELSADVEPSVSTDRRRFMIAPASARDCEPFERIAVVTAGRAVGMAATMNATALRKSSWSWTLRYRPSAVESDQGDPGDDEDLVRERIELLGQRRLLDRRRLEHPADVTDLGRHAGRHDEDRAGTTGDLAVHEGHVHTVAEGGIGRDGVHLLGRRDALAGQGGFVDLERGGRQDPGVGRDEVAGFDVDDVTRDQLVDRDFDEIAAPADLGLDDHHLLERGGARFRLALLVHGHPGVEHGQQEEEDAGVELSGQEQADDACDQQHELHRIGVVGA